jgi:hypothetical protein
MVTTTIYSYFFGSPNICLYTALGYHFNTMKSIFFVGIIAAAMTLTTITGIGLVSATAQMADNATMGNMTGGNMTEMGTFNMTEANTTEATGSISSCGTECF